MIIQAPYAMRTCWLKSICGNELPHDIKIPKEVSLLLIFSDAQYVRFNDQEHNLPFNMPALYSILEMPQFP